MGFFPDLPKVTAVNLGHCGDVTVVQIAVKKIQRFTRSFIKFYDTWKFFAVGEKLMIQLFGRIFHNNLRLKGVAQNVKIITVR